MKITHQSVQTMSCIWIKTRKVSLQSNVRHNFMLSFTRHISIRQNNLQISTQCSCVNIFKEKLSWNPEVYSEKIKQESLQYYGIIRSLRELRAEITRANLYPTPSSVVVQSFLYVVLKCYWEHEHKFSSWGNDIWVTCFWSFLRIQSPSFSLKLLLQSFLLCFLRWQNKHQGRHSQICQKEYRTNYTVKKKKLTASAASFAARKRRERCWFILALGATPSITPRIK